MVKSNFRFASESGRSECWDLGSSLCLLMAESSRWLTSVNGNFGLNSGRTGAIFLDRDEGREPTQSDRFRMGGMNR